MILYIGLTFGFVRYSIFSFKSICNQKPNGTFLILMDSPTIWDKKELRSFFYSLADLFSSYCSCSLFLSAVTMILWGDVISTSGTLTRSNILNFKSYFAVGRLYGFIWSIASIIYSSSGLVCENTSLSVFSNLVVLEYTLFRYISPSWSCTKEKSWFWSIFGNLLRILKS